MDALTFLEKTVERLRGFGGHYAEIARRSGISYSSLVKLAQGHADNPTIETLQRVIEALDAFEGKPQACAADPSVSPANQAGEGAEVDPDSNRIIPVEAA